MAKIGVESKIWNIVPKILLPSPLPNPTQMPLTSGREISAARKQHYTRLHLHSCQDCHKENHINGHLAWARGCGWGTHVSVKDPRGTESEVSKVKSGSLHSDLQAEAAAASKIWIEITHLSPHGGGRLALPSPFSYEKRSELFPR